MKYFPEFLAVRTILTARAVVARQERGGSGQGGIFFVAGWHIFCEVMTIQGWEWGGRNHNNHRHQQGSHLTTFKDLTSRLITSKQQFYSCTGISSWCSYLCGPIFHENWKTSGGVQRVPYGLSHRCFKSKVHLREYNVIEYRV